MSCEILLFEASLGVDDPESTKNHLEYNNILCNQACVLRERIAALIASGGNFSSTKISRIRLIYDDAVINAIFHGNLGCSSKMRSLPGGPDRYLQSFYQKEKYGRNVLIRLDSHHSTDDIEPCSLHTETIEYPTSDYRSHNGSFSIITTHNIVKVDSMSRLSLTVKDGGGGFDHKNLPEPTPEQAFGRGVSLIKNLSDETEYNEKGNQLRVFFDADVNPKIPS